MCPELIGRKEMHIVGRDDRYASITGQRHGAVQIFLVTRPAGALQFQVETVLEQLLPVVQQALRAVGLVRQQGLADVAGAATGKRDQPVRGTRQPGLLQYRQSAMLALGVAARNQLGQMRSTPMIGFRPAAMAAR
jgi:hypothetical protein